MVVVVVGGDVEDGEGACIEEVEDEVVVDGNNSTGPEIARQKNEAPKPVVLC